MKQKLVRTTTIPRSLRVLLSGQLKYMSDFYDVIAISSGGDEFEQVKSEQGVRGYVVPFTRKTFSIVSDLKAFFKLIQIFRKEKPYIVHSHTSKDGLLCMVAAFICRVPNRIYTIAGLADIAGVRGMMLNLAEWLTFKCATKIYPNSKNMMDIYLANHSFSAKKAKVILNGSSNGIDTEYFSSKHFTENTLSDIRKQYGISSDAFNFIYIGRLVGDKGVNELIQAFERVSKEYVNARLIVVGNYEADLDKLEDATIDSIHNNSKIIFVGYQIDVRPFILLSQTLILPSYREGMPNVVMQAGALDTASIVTNINGCNEIIIDNINGSIIPRKDVEALYDKMKYYLQNPDIVAAMGQKSRDLIISRYERTKIWKALLDEYQTL